MLLTGRVAGLTYDMAHDMEEVRDGVNDDSMRVSIPEDKESLVAVEFPLAIKPTKSGTQTALDMIGGIEELTRVAADEVWYELAVLTC